MDWVEPNTDAMEAQVGGGLFFRPKVGTYRVRFAPPWSKAGTLYKLEALHYGFKDHMGNRVTLPCRELHSPTRDCPVCLYIQKLGKGDATKSLRQEIRQTLRYNLNLALRTEAGDMGWQVWAAGMTVAKALNATAKMFKDLKRPHFAHPDKGVDFTLQVVGEKFERRYTLLPDGPKEVCPVGVAQTPHDLDALISPVPLEYDEMVDLIKRNYGHQYPWQGETKPGVAAEVVE